MGCYKIVKLCILFFVLANPLQLSAQTLPHEFSVMFYNTENYFDTINNPSAQDDFTPDDIYGWNTERFIKKRNGIAQIIIDINNGDSPDVIGLCEVENYTVLQQLIDSTALKQHPYTIVHHDSPDARGIDVALLYKTNRFKLINTSFFLMGNILNNDKREILYAKGIVPNGDTLHVFVNHFPSKRDGVAKTAPQRMAAAQALRQTIDSLLISNSSAKIVAMGDFNDTYNSKTIVNGLRAINKFPPINDTAIYNLSGKLAKAGAGSIKYRNRWQMVDMFFVSGNLLQPSSTFITNQDSVQIFSPDYLLEYVESTNSYRPKPTYRWINYIGGYSDHLPILMKLHYH